MKEKLIRKAFQIIRDHPEIKWEDAHYLLLTSSFELNRPELSRDIFYSIVLGTLQYKTKWMLEDLSNEKSQLKRHKDLKKIGVLDFAQNLLKIISWPKKKIRVPRILRLCACCHDFVLSTNEIQEFPITNTQQYIVNTFDKALTEKEFKKREFLINYILNQYLLTRDQVDPELFFKLWLKAEQLGIPVEASFLNGAIPFDTILTEKLSPYLYQILNFRHEDHDPIIDDIIQHLLEKDLIETAYYFNTRISNPTGRIFDAICEVLNLETPKETHLEYLKQVYESVKHEKLGEK